MIDHGVGFVVHDERYAIIGSLSQVESCDNRDCDSRIISANGGMEQTIKLRPEAADIFQRIDALGIKQVELATALDIDENKVSKMRGGTRRIQGPELLKARQWLTEIESKGGYRETDDLPYVDPQQDYVSIEVLPTFAGCGGGGTGDGDRAVALIDRALIEDILRGRPSDFVLVHIRGDSMEPEFHHGDQLLVDKRDKVTAQPGPFALWDGDWDEFVVKNVERIDGGNLRIFSSNAKYSDRIVNPENSRIIGRPVWFGRRL